MVSPGTIEKKMRNEKRGRVGKRFVCIGPSLGGVTIWRGLFIGTVAPSVERPFRRCCHLSLYISMSVAPRLLSVALLSITLVACTTSQNVASESSSDRIVVEDPGAVSGLTAYDLVEERRSLWLQRRGRKSIRNEDPIRVYVDGSGSPFGTIADLRGISATDVDYIEHFDGNAAQMRFGQDNSSGAIVVYTRQR